MALLQQLVLMMMWFMGVIAAEGFSTPPPSDPNASLAAQATYQVGSSVTIAWTTSLDSYTIALWQNVPGKDAKRAKTAVYGQTQAGAPQSYTWTVETYDLVVDSSSLWYLWLHKGSLEDSGSLTDGFTCAYFNISQPGPASSSAAATAIQVARTSTTSSEVSSQTPSIPAKQATQPAIQEASQQTTTTQSIQQTTSQATKEPTSQPTQQPTQQSKQQPSSLSQTSSTSKSTSQTPAQPSLSKTSSQTSSSSQTTTTSNTSSTAAAVVTSVASESDAKTTKTKSQTFTTTMTTQTSQAAPTSSQPASSSGAGLSSGAKAGIVVAVVLACSLGVIPAFIWFRRYLTSHDEESPAEVDQGPVAKIPSFPLELSSTSASGFGEPAELDRGREMCELPHEMPIQFV